MGRIDHIVFSGAPGAGKTTLIKELSRGFHTFPESARIILADKAGQKLRRDNPESYALACIDLDIENYRKASKSSKPEVFDRGIGDYLAHLRLADIEISDQLKKLAERHRYRGLILLFPVWPEIYEQDNLRCQNVEEAEASFFAVRDMWAELGYQTLEVPKASLEKRKEFCLSLLS